MFNHSSKKNAKNQYRRFFFNVGAVAIIVIVVLVLVADIKIYRRKRELNARVMSLQEKIQQLQSQNAALKESAGRAGEEDYIEKIAREELDLQQPGEKVISFVPAKDLQKTLAPQKNTWLEWLGKWFKK